MLGAWFVLLVLPLLIVGLAVAVFMATRGRTIEKPSTTPEPPTPESAPRA